MRLTSRRSLWAPALVLAGAAVGVAAMLGVTSASATWPAWIVGFAALIAGVAWFDRRLHPEPAVPEPELEPEPERRRGRPAGAPGPGYDLERDRTTDKQRYLM